MARRIRSTLFDKDIQSLKLGAPNALVLSKDQQVIFRQDRKPPVYEAKIFAKFDSNDFDGIHLLGYIIKNDKDIIHGANCTFRIYKANLDDSWSETLLYTTSGSIQSNGSFKASITQSNLGSLNELDGELTLAIEIEIKRFKKVFKKKIYINDLGIYDSFIRVKKKVDFLTITKKNR